MVLQRVISYSLLGLLISFLLFASNTLKAQDTEVRSVRVLNVDYFGAELEVDLFLAEKEEEDPAKYFYLLLDAQVANPLKTKVDIAPGNNKVTVYIPRSEHREFSVTVKEVLVQFFKGNRRIAGSLFNNEPFYTEVYRLKIVWPSPQDATESIVGSVPIGYDFSAITRLHLNRRLPEEEGVVRVLLQNGLPISRIYKYEPSPNFPVRKTITLAKEIGFAAQRKLLSVLIKELGDVEWVKLEDLGANDFVYVGSMPARNKKPPALGRKAYIALREGMANEQEFYSYLNFKQIDKSESFDARHKKAAELLDNSNKWKLKEAKKILDGLIQKNPKYAPAYVELARYHMKSDWPKGLLKAEKLLLEALELKPDLADAHVLLGYVYTKQKRFSAAVAEYQKAKRLSTDNLWLYANWGLNYQMQGQAQEALDMYLSVLRTPSPRQNTTYVRRWVYKYSEFFGLLVALGKIREAEVHYDEFAEKYREFKCIYQDKAALRLYYTDNVSGAIRSYLKAEKYGCERDSATLALAYYMRWANLSKLSNNTLELEETVRKADLLAPEDAVLLYAAAISAKTSSLIPVLLANGKKIDRPDSRGMTALLYSIANQHIFATRTLLQSGSSVNRAYEFEGRFYAPLLIALQTENKDMIRLLLEFKADPSVRLPNGLTIEQLAQQMGMEELLRLLKRNSSV
ncbi:ankyrin repeat domain-containing protein [Pontibacterium sp. N1Y112]|uniref:Ankyrin repeat domain-containing protein n=1 Tax=Pontibacterium sinense TaxID=2781979 RepID=A0A8J7FSQ0_9GAMM|nr:ankyrin repeat domain-containing protein [Pontibacterium sinense]MBE9396540.1 ankyrin repeat domain-containing protein [Pontibacterium sinense]